MSSGGKLHLRGRPPFNALTVCGLAVKADTVVAGLEGRANACQSCWRMRAQAAPDVGRKRAPKAVREP